MKVIISLYLCGLAMDSYPLPQMDDLEMDFKSKVYIQGGI